MPHVKKPRQGWLGAANHRPIGSFYPIPSGLTRKGFGGPARRLYERMQALDRFTPEDVLDVHCDTVNPVKRDIVWRGFHLRDVMRLPLSDEAEKALKHLEGWYAAERRWTIEFPVRI